MCAAPLSPGGGVIKCECVINALCLSDLRFSLVRVQERTGGHYSCACCDTRRSVCARFVCRLLHARAFRRECVYVVVCVRARVRCVRLRVRSCLRVRLRDGLCHRRHVDKQPQTGLCQYDSRLDVLVQSIFGRYRLLLPQCRCLLSGLLGGLVLAVIHPISPAQAYHRPSEEM